MTPTRTAPSSRPSPAALIGTRSGLRPGRPGKHQPDRTRHQGQSGRSRGSRDNSVADARWPARAQVRLERNLAHPANREKMTDGHWIWYRPRAELQGEGAHVGEARVKAVFDDFDSGTRLVRLDDGRAFRADSGIGFDDASVRIVLAEEPDDSAGH